MCFHLTVGLISRCRRRTEDNSERWQLQTYCMAAGYMLFLIVTLVVISLVLEWGRGRQWSTVKGLSRQVTVIPLCLACALFLCSSLEAICMYRTILVLSRRARFSAGDFFRTEPSLDPPSPPSDDNDDADPTTALEVEDGDQDTAEEPIAIDSLLPPSKPEISSDSDDGVSLLATPTARQRHPADTKTA